MKYTSRLQRDHEAITNNNAAKVVIYILSDPIIIL